MKDSETLVSKSDYEEEWYTFYYVCQSCEADFMADKPKYCPCCGRKIIGEASRNGKIYDFSNHI